MVTAAAARGVATGGISVFIPPKSAQVNFLWDKSDVRTGALKSQVLENVSTENASTKQDILQGWKMQVRKT